MFKNFRYLDLVFRVGASKSAHLVWLEEFLSPQFQTVDDGSYDCEILLIEDTSQFEALLSKGVQADGARRGCFALDNQLVHLPVCPSPDNLEILFDEELRVFYLVNQDRSEVRLLTFDNNPRARMPLMSVVREFATRRSQQTGLVLHSSCFAFENEGFLIAGPKEAGKTTLLIHALRHAATRYVSNDRVAVSFTSNGPMLRGLPTLVTIRQPTVEMFPHLRRGLMSASFNHHLNLDETAERPAGPTRPWRNGRVGLTPAQFCAVLGASSVAEAPARALLFPRATREAGGIQLKRISAQAGANRLADGLFGGLRWENASNTFCLPDDRVYHSRQMLDALIQKLASQVRCFDCLLGTEAYDSDNSPAEFINGLVKSSLE